MNPSYPTFESMYLNPAPSAQQPPQQAMAPQGFGDSPSAAPSQDMGANPWGRQMDLWASNQQAAPQAPQQKAGKK